MTNVRTVTNGQGLVPRDDRAWPRASFAISLVFLLAALGAGAGCAAAASDREPLFFGSVVGAFGVTTVFTAVVYAVGMRAWLRGADYPGSMRLLMLLVLVVGVVLWVFDPLLGGAAVSGLIAGMFSANAWAIRAARANRDAVDQAEATRARERESAPREDPPLTDAGPTVEPTVEPPSVGRVLRHNVVLERQRAIAWLAAGAAATVACAALDTAEAVTFVVVVTALMAFIWVLRRLWGSWLALRDFNRATHPPRRAFVVLLHDPTPRMIRPLLAIWPEEPEGRGGRLPRAEAVYRCDDELLDLQCYQGDVVVHEAWVDTGPRSRSKPRWVAADAGITLPHRRSLFGRWFVGSLIGGERPDRARPLTMPAPRPDADVTIELDQDAGSFVVALAWRLLALAVIGLLMVLLI